MARYYTVVQYDPDLNAWHDTYGFTSKADAEEEREGMLDGITRARHVKIIVTDGTAKSLIDYLNKLNATASRDA